MEVLEGVLLLLLLKRGVVFVGLLKLKIVVLWEEGRRVEGKF